MHKPIRVLPREIAEKIAAGEVVERPGSVLKELVENSLDAGARSIRVELEEGGRKRLTVLDDGHGIADDQILVALERHATSKIQELDDLWNLSTMGFRGEALPSIAAVSRFTIESRATDFEGRQVYLEGGRLLRNDLLPAQSLVRKTGTFIAVEDLFFNVPARLKFLKSKSGESSHIRELLERIALCNPAVAFTLLSEGRRSLNLSSADALSRVAAVLETKPENIETFESQFEDISVIGWMDRDGRASNSRHLYLSVNGRMVRDKLLQHAALQALRPRMMEGEYPRLFLSVQIPPMDVDVNVHPAKSEVRFRRARDVFQVVHGALERVAREPTRPFYSTPQLPEADQSKLFASDRVAYKAKDYVALNVGGLVAAFEPPPEAPAPLQPLPQSITNTSPGFSRLHYIGQLKNTYLLFQDEEGLVLIDQHAAHERINYEKIKAEFLSSGLRSQPLLISAVVKCKAEDIGIAADNADAFTRLGFEFEAFGDNCLLVRASPEGLTPDRATELFRAVLEELRDADSAELTTEVDPSRLSAKLERLLATSACHASVRAGQALATSEARRLAEEMDLTPSSLNCPHGRPASIRVTIGQIEGLFKRG